MIPNYVSYKELHKHKGTTNYQLETVVPHINSAESFYLDTISKRLYIYSYYLSKLKKDNTFDLLQMNLLGHNIENYETGKMLKDGTLKGFDYYSNWIINSDKTKHKFIDPISNEVIENPYDYEWKEKDFEKWFEIFKKLYETADYVYIHSSFYFFKTGDKWYLLDDTLDDSPDNFRVQYPPKQNKNARMVQLRDLCPDFFKSRDKRDTSFVDIVGYEETDNEKGSGLNPISYSAGNYYLNLYMPLGDTIKIKRHGSMGVNMQFYKIPVTQGGRNDVVFIVQEPNEMYPDTELGGMYVVRPRSLDQKQYGPHESSADSYAGQYNSIKRGTNPELKFLKPMKD